MSFSPAWSSPVESLESRCLLSAPTSFSSRGPGGGGAFFSPSFSPYNAQELFAVSDMTGLYHSTNAAASWNLADFRQIQGGRGTQVQFTSDPSILYTLDYTDLPDGSSATRPAKSTDGGATWDPVPGWDSSNQAYALYADPNNTTRMIVSDYGALYFSGDGGTSFSLKFTAPDSGQGCYVAGAFFDANTIYVGTSAGLLVSTNGGSSFALSAATGLPAGKPMVSLAGAKQGATTRLFASLADTSDVYNGLFLESVPNSSFAGIYSLDAGSGAWVNRSAAIPAGDYPMLVSMARNNISTVYAAGPSDASAPIVIKSTTAGASWANVLVTANNQNVATGWQGAGGDRGWSFGELALGFGVAPLDANTLAFTDYGYLHLSTDGGANWRQGYLNPADQNAPNTTITQHKAYRGVGFEDTSALWMTWPDASTIIAGYTDIYGVRSTDGGASWAFPTNLSLSGNTVYQVSSLATGSVPSGIILYAAASGTHDIYQSTHLTDSSVDGGNGRILYSNDKGASWATLHDFGHPVVYTAIDPTNANRMYASVVSSTVGGIYVTSNLSAGAASTWTKVTNPPRTQGHPYNIKVLNDGTLVVSYSARRTSAFTNSSGVFVSTDHGLTWADRTLIGSAGNPGMQFYTKDITIDPTDASQNIWFAAVRSGWGGNGNGMGGLYKTLNRGVNWTRIFSTDSAESATINPATGEMYVSTLSSGLYYSSNYGVASPTFFAVASYLFRQPERIFINPFNSSEVWVTSFGYGLAVSAPADATPPTVTGTSFIHAAAPHAITFTFSESVGASIGIGDLSLKNNTTNATLAPASAVWSEATKTATYTFSGALDDGAYTATLAAGQITDAAGNPMAASATWNFIYAGGGAGSSNDAYVVRLGGGSTVQVFKNIPVGPTPSMSAALGTLSLIAVDAQAGDDGLTLDFSGGNFVPSGSAGFTFDGGTGTDTVAVQASGATDVASFSTNSISFNGASIALAGSERSAYSNSGGLDTLGLASGTLTLVGTQQLQSLTLGAVSTATLAPGITILTRALSLSPTAILDIGTGALILDYTGPSPLAAIKALIVSARNGLDANTLVRWDGYGITSSAARASSLAAGFDLYTLGLLDNGNFADPGIGRAPYTTFRSLTTDSTSLLLRYTYSGDADLNGFVDGDDYALIDNAFNSLIPNFGWLSGDFNHDGNIDGDDYALIDSGFLFQQGPLL